MGEVGLWGFGGFRVSVCMGRKALGCGGIFTGIRTYFIKDMSEVSFGVLKGFGEGTEARDFEGFRRATTGFGFKGLSARKQRLGISVREQRVGDFEGFGELHRLRI